MNKQCKTLAIIIEFSSGRGLATMDADKPRPLLNSIASVLQFVHYCPEDSRNCRQE